jgi:tetratricopeptide (TPR) repeat protein
MMRMTRRTSYAVVFAAVFMMLAASVAAQTGGVRGKVTDPSGKPVEGAQVVIQSKESARKLEVKTDKKGEFIQIGIFPGEYVITVTKDTLKSQMEQRVGLGDAAYVEIRLQPAAADPEEAKKKLAELQAVFDAGVAAVRADNYDEGIAKFEQTIAMAPTCGECYYNLGIAYARKKDIDKALAAQLKAAELKPTDAATWSELASLYNQKGQPDKATEASNKAAELAAATPTATGGGGGGTAPALYNQGVILWNQNKFAEAKEKFDSAVKADPKHAESQFMVGMAALNVAGDVKAAIAAFETYLQLAPNGPNAAKAKQNIADLKQ